MKTVTFTGLSPQGGVGVFGKILWDGTRFTARPMSRTMASVLSKPIRCPYLPKTLTTADGEEFLNGLRFMYRSAYLMASAPEETAEASLSLEPITEVAYGTDPPGSGWTYAGEMKWQRIGGRPRIAVVGGGPGGLFVTHILNQKLPSAAVTIFEASDRLGGKIRTDHFKDGTPFEAGVAEMYEYLGPGPRDPLRTLIEEDLGLPTVDMSGGGVVLRAKLLRDHDDLEREFGEETRKAVERFHKKMAKLMPLEKYASRWQPDNEHPWADKTFRDCIREELNGNEIAIEYVEAAVASDLATESYTCNGLNGIKNVLLDNDEYMQLYHVIGGIERVPEALIEKMRADVRLGCRVLSVCCEEGGYRVTFQKEGQEQNEGFDYVVVAMPNHWLAQLKWCCPGMKEAVHSILAHYDLPAHYFRVSMNFRENWWEKFGFPGDFWMMDMLNGCCVYDESKRWRSTRGHVLSFLLCGQDALNMVSHNQTDEEIARHVIESMPEEWRTAAVDNLEEVRIDSYAGSINAQPGGWPVEELRGEHQPEPEKHKGVVLCGDYFFDSTLNAALISAYTAVDILLETAGMTGRKGTAAVESLGGKL